MDEPVPRRSFVRLVAGDAVQNAGRLAALSGLAAGMVAHGVAGLADAVDAAGPPPVAERPTADSPTPTSAFAPPPGVLPSLVLDAATLQTLATTSHLLLLVNRHQAGPFANRYPFAFDGGSVRIETRASSAMAQHIRRDAFVTLMLDEPATGQRLMLSGRATLLEGAAAPDGAPGDPERALIVVEPRSIVRVPL